jgi:hypothetical protein
MELKKYAQAKRGRSNPEYYIFATNVVLSAVSGSGMKDKAFDALGQAAKTLDFRGFDIWDYDTICRHLDAHPGVRQSFAALITPHDVIAELLSHLPESKRRNELGGALTLFLQRELRSAQYVRLEQAGLSAEQRTPLARVFIDLPIERRSPKQEDEAESKIGIVATILRAGHSILRPSTWAEAGEARTSGGISSPISAKQGRTVVVGGPGQGKSTAAQFACQLYRAALLSDRPRVLLSAETMAALNSLREQCASEGIPIPSHRRFPFHLVLERFAAALARGETRSVIGYIAASISTATDRAVSPDDVRAWLSTAPWFIVLDGLDEVPAASNRTDVLEHLEAFGDELAALDADVQLVATTRPQGYSNEFSPALFLHLHLGPLSRTQALHYADRLTDVRHVDDPDRKREVMDRLRGALTEAATARLMQTPLQVTLMATLVEQIGEPPRERWRLFHQYYGAVYAREIERDIATSRLLQGRRADIDAIHHRVGLLLQTEGERPSETGDAAQLSANRFIRLVRDRLEENGVEGTERDALSLQIKKAATDRLVFLVQPEEDKVGFEIRSLQEFAAAEALLTGREAHVHGRLTAIAPIPYWRNVFLFAAGRCFADTQHQHLREDILAICDELNSDEADPLAATSYEGSRLALDILRDGVAREQPRYARWLAERALKILSAPIDRSDIESNDIIGLADAYDPPLRAVFEEAIRFRLDLGRLDQQLAGWLLLSTLADKGVEWATAVADKRWPPDQAHQHAIFASFPEPMSGPWSTKRFLALYPNINPVELRKIGWISINVSAMEGASPWHIAAFAAVAGRAVSMQNELLFPTRFTTSLKRDEIVICDLTLTASSTSEWLTELAPLLSEPPSHSGWEFYQTIVKHALHPSAMSLAAALRYVGNHWDTVRNISPPSWTPWPLHTCLAVVTTAADAFQLAEHAATGQLGSQDDWSTGERRWKVHGITVEDLLYTAQEDLPIGPWIATRGFPLTTAGLQILKPSKNRFGLLYDIVRVLPSGRIREQAAAHCLTLLQHIVQTPSSEGEQRTNLCWLPMEKLGALLTAAPNASFRLAIINELEVDPWSTGLLLDVLEQIGGPNNQNERTTMVNLERDAMWARSWPYAEVLLDAFEAAPQRIGLLTLLGSLSIIGVQISISETALESYRISNDPGIREAVSLIDISQGKWDEEITQRISDDIVFIAASNSDPNGRLRFFLTAIEHQPTAASAARQRLLVAVRRKLLESHDLARDAGIVTPHIRTLLSRRLSPLQDGDRWRALGLPVLPDPPRPSKRFRSKENTK